MADQPGVVSYKLEEPFDIEDQLDDVHPEDAFVMGVQWSMFRVEVLEVEAGRRPESSAMVYAENADRLEAMAKRHGLEVTREAVEGMEDEWVSLTIRKPAAPALAIVPNPDAKPRS